MATSTSKHYLVVHEHVEDGLDIEHEGCPMSREDLSDGSYILTFECEVGAEERNAGLSDYFKHRDDPYEQWE